MVWEQVCLLLPMQKMQLGIELVAQTIYLEDKIKEADYVFTGEGGMDYQTKFGKAPYGVCKNC